nr:2570_t:CDS:2 [Entrophospora candida]
MTYPNDCLENEERSWKKKEIQSVDDDADVMIVMVVDIRLFQPQSDASIIVTTVTIYSAITHSIATSSAITIEIGTGISTTTTAANKCS